jgi:uncharacterized membrane protein
MVQTSLNPTPNPAESDPHLYGVQMQAGPLPPAAELAAYEKALPGSAERIIAMAEASQKADIQEVVFEQRARLLLALLGQSFLFFLIAAAVYLAIHDKPLEAFFTGLAPIAIAIYANLRGKPHDQTNSSNLSR